MCQNQPICSQFQKLKLSYLDLYIIKYINMQLLNKTTLTIAAVVSTATAFAPSHISARPATGIASSTVGDFNNVDPKFYFMEEKVQEQETTVTPQDLLPVQQKKIPKKVSPSKKSAAHGKSGLFSPLVLSVKDAWGDEKEFNKFRATVISKHSDVISSFVKTSDSSIGKATLKTLFQLADKDKNGVIDEVELAEAFAVLGFDWMKEKQLKGIYARADKDGNGEIDLEEWIIEAPVALRTNLIKLAKKNGGELGFLA